MSTEQTISPPLPKVRSRAPFFLWGAVMLLSGIGIGAGGTMLLHHHGPPMMGHRPFGPPDFQPDQYVDEMTKELNLSSDQAKQVKDVYGKSLDAIKTLHQSTQVSLEAEHEKLRDSLRQILTPLQFAQWDQSYLAERAKMMPGEPPPHDHDGPGGDHGPGGPPGDFGHHGPGGPDMNGPHGGPDGFGGPGGPPGDRG